MTSLIAISLGLLIGFCPIGNTRIIKILVLAITGG